VLNVVCKNFCFTKISVFRENFANIIVYEFLQKFSHFQKNIRIFAKISYQKLKKISETLMMWTTWGMGPQIETSLLK
jgi:hypothetical protein